MAQVASFDLVNSATIAACLGVTERRVQQLVNDGVISCVKRGNANRFNLIETISAYIENLRDEADSDVKKDLKDRKLLADARYRETKTEQEELRLEELKGTMHRSDDVRDATEMLVYSIRSALIAFPGRLAVDVVHAETAADAQQIIRKEVNGILSELSEFSYDPEVYERMVREREGMRINDDEDDGEDSS